MLETYYNNQRQELDFDKPNLSGKVLEIGCGDGSYLDTITCDQKWAIEPFSVEHKCTTYHKLFKVPFSDCFDELPQNYFDHIVMNDVLEHMWDTEDVLAKIHTLLRPGGSIRLSIPNVAYIENLYLLIYKGTWDYQNYGILDKTHMRFFTKNSIEKYFTRGWTKETITGLNSIGKNNGGKWLFIDFVLKLIKSDKRFLQFHVVYTKNEDNA